MAVNSQDLIDEAKRIHESCSGQPNIPSTEVKVRIGVRTAYYAAYHSARKQAIKENFTFSSGRGSHENVWNEWCLGFRNLEDIFGTADMLKGMRHRADYELHGSMLNATCSDAIEMAEEVIAAIGAL